MGFLASLLCFLIPVCARCAEARTLRLGHFPNVTHAQAVYARAGGQFEQKYSVFSIQVE